MSFDYDDAPFSGAFLAALSRPGDDMAYSHAIEADNLAHLDALLVEYCGRHGFVVEEVTFAGRRVPGFGGSR